MYTENNVYYLLIMIYILELMYLTYMLMRVHLWHVVHIPYPVTYRLPHISDSRKIPRTHLDIIREE